MTKIKYNLTTAGVLLLFRFATAVPYLNEWAFERDRAGLTLSQAANSGRDGSVFSSGGVGFLETDGEGRLVCTYSGGETGEVWYSGAVLDADIPDIFSESLYIRFDFRFDFSDTPRSGAVLGIGTVDSLGLHTAGLAAVYEGEGYSLPAERTITPVATNLFSGSRISAIMKVNLDNQTMSVWYDLTGGNNFDETNPAASDVLIHLEDIDKLWLQATGDFRPAGSTDYASVDNIRTASTWEEIITPLARAKPLAVHPLFHQNMVLQRDIAAPVWGRVTPDTTVNITLDGVIAGTEVADENGDWVVKLGPYSADGGMPHVLRIISEREEIIQINDVVFGDVYIAAGQSNMEKAMYGAGVGGVDGYEEEVAVANTYPLIRHVALFRTNSVTARSEPVFRLNWTKCSSSSLANFTAVGYFFAKNIHLATGVPVGLVNAAWGGQDIERFLSPSGVAAVPELSGLRQYQEQGGVTNLYDIYNAMIVPLIPYGVRGVIWYQGENNGNDSYLYQHKMQALIRGWRYDWGQGNFPFYYVQLPNYSTTAGWTEVRDAQFRTLAETNTGMAVTIDVGNDGDIHPSNKTDVGYRLAQWALAKDYKQNRVCSGPLYRNAIVEGSQIRVIFDYADGGLVVGQKSGANPVEVIDGPLQNFSIAGPTGSFVGATAVIDKDSILVSSPNITTPVHVRYGYANAPTGVNKLYNAAGLPASPFRTDEGYRIDVRAGTGNSPTRNLPGEQVPIVASAAVPGKVFDRWIGAASEIENLHATNTTVTMPTHALYLLAAYRNESDPIYTLTVSNGFGGGDSRAGSIINIEAASPSSGQVFDYWSGDTEEIINIYDAHTTLRMPARNVIIVPVYRIIDSVGDGLPDAWRALYFGGDGTSTSEQSGANADPDGDGMSNWKEYVSGTFPLDAQSFLCMGSGFSSEGFHLRFQSTEGIRYRIEKTGSLINPVWEVVNYNINGDGMAKQIGVGVGADLNAFFKLDSIR